MKKRILSIALCLSTSALFSQITINFSLYVTNPTDCPYTITGTWANTGGIGQQGPLAFLMQDTTSTPQDIWYGNAVDAGANETMTICVEPVFSCDCETVCISQVPIQTDSIAIVICDGLVGVAEQQNLPLADNKYYDLLGRKIMDMATYPVYSFYITGGKKYIKVQ